MLRKKELLSHLELQPRTTEDRLDKKECKIIFGIDPGTRVTGYGIIRVTPFGIEPVDFGAIRPPPDLPLSERHRILFESLESLVAHFQPDALAVETQFVYKNVQSALKLGMVRGVALLAAARRGLPIYEYAPRKAKLAVVGTGAASKEQVQKMVQLLLRLPHPPEPEDAADALALAICHSNTLNRRGF